MFWPAPSALTTILIGSPPHNADYVVRQLLRPTMDRKRLPRVMGNSSHELEKIGRVGPGLTLYGLRHTVAVILRECGFDERTIADALGQKTIEMARHYAKGADLKRKMRGVVTELDAEVNRRRTKVVKPT